MSAFAGNASRRPHGSTRSNLNGVLCSRKQQPSSEPAFFCSTRIHCAGRRYSCSNNQNKKSLALSVERVHRRMRESFDPSRVKLYIRPFRSRMNPTTGLVILLVSIEPPTPRVTIATEPSTPTFQPCVLLKRSRAVSAMNAMMTNMRCLELFFEI